MEDAFRRSLPDDFRLIETFRWDARARAGGQVIDIIDDSGSFNPSRAINLEDHLARLERTARLFGIAFDRAAIDRALGVARGDQPLRLRLTLGRDGVPEVAVSPFEAGPPVWNVAIAAERLDPADPWLRVKTTERALYDATRAALPPGVHEMLFLNTRGEVCEGTICNVFVKLDDVFLTPRLACGLLPGVFRQILLRRGQAREAVPRLEDLRRGQLFLGNSLRGLIPARLV